MVHSQVMLIEDDLDLGHALLSVLRAEEFQVEWLRRVVDAERQWGERFDAVLLDIRLPDGCGLDLLGRWRQRGIATPVLMITAQADLRSRIHGLDHGADDYLVKPFEPLELVARLRAVLRRSAGQSHSVWRIGELAINSCTHAVTVEGVAVSLSPTEYDLLLMLAQKRGAVVSKSRILKAMSPWGAEPNPGAIDFHVFNLRKKLGPHRIQTVRGVGYLLVH